MRKKLISLICIFVLSLIIPTNNASAGEIKNIEEFKKAIVIVTEAVYPGTTITIYNRHLAVNEPLKAVFFKYIEQEVVAADMDELDPSS